MKLIQLQRLDPLNHENIGGLYINPCHISAIFPHKVTRGFTWLELSNGCQYLIPIPIHELLDVLQQ